MGNIRPTTDRSWPKHLSYVPLSMGMIQPEWVYMSHYFDERAEEHAHESTITPLCPPTAATPQIQIHFRSRK